MSSNQPYPVRIIEMTNLPASFVDGWRMECPPRWTLSGMILGAGWQRPSVTSIARQRRCDFGLCVLIAIQWLLIGSFPLTRPGHWFREPGAMITACMVLVAPLAIVPRLDVLSGLPAVVAAFAWLYRFGLLIRTILSAGWRLALRKPADSSADHLIG
jgi:hypothetical protein